MKRFITACILFQSCAIQGFSQIDDVVRSKKINDRIFLYLDDPKSFKYVIDKTPMISIAKSIDDKLDVSARDDKFNLMVHFLNPIKYRIKVSETSEADPVIESTNKFFSSIVDVLNMVNPGGSTSTNGVASPGYVKATSAFITPAADRVAADIKRAELASEVMSLIRSESLLDLALWILNPSNDCLLEDDKVNLLKALAKCDDAFFKFNKDALGLLDSMQKIESIQSIKNNKTAYENAINALKTLNDENVVFLSAITTTIEAITYKSSEFCKMLDPYIKYKINNYTNIVTPVLESRKKVISDFRSLNTSLLEIATKSEGDFFLLQEIKSEPGMIKLVEVSITAKNIELGDKGITVTESDYGKFKFKVREYSSIALEFGAGVLHTTLTYKKYGTETENNITKVVEAGKDKISASAASMLNLVINAGKSWVYPMLQLGIGTGNKYPILFAGGGLRSIKPLNHFAITFGPVWTWKQNLTIPVNSEVSGSADVEKNLKWEFNSSPGFYLGFQYSF